MASTIVLNMWQFVASSWVAGDGGIRLWRGTLTTPVVELVYNTRTDGTGSNAVDTSDDLIIGNFLGGTRTFAGLIEHLPSGP